MQTHYYIIKNNKNKMHMKLFKTNISRVSERKIKWTQMLQMVDRISSNIRKGPCSKTRWAAFDVLTQ